MLGLALVRSLEDDWRETLDAVAMRRHWPTTRDVSELAVRVGRLSAAYNCATVAHAAARDAGAARLGFAFARDVPKGAAAVRELVARGLVGVHDRPLRVLDVGAGLGATTWGLVRALHAAGSCVDVEATWLDPDTHALEIGLEVLHERHRRARIGPRVTVIPRAASPGRVIDGLGRFDVVLVGQVLSELDVSKPAAERVQRHATLLGALLDHCTNEGGALVAIEPALRDRTRHLHAVRNELVALGATIFAPCLHCAPCPALDRETDWCHEDLPVDLPRWLAPVARAAGLRREGLTFSYLVARKDRARLADGLEGLGGAARLRVVSQPMRSKGKLEMFVCGEFAHDFRLVAARVKATRLDRDACDRNATWEKLQRGDVLAVDPSPTTDRPRIGVATKIVRLADESR